MAVEYWIDTGNRLLRFNDDWRVFAIENGAPELASTAILGQPLASFCSDPTTAEIWAQFLARARTGADVRVRIRCDAPERRRWLELSLLVDGTSIRVVSSLLSEEPRPRSAVLEAHRSHVTGALECCSWCKRWRSAAPGWRWRTWSRPSTSSRRTPPCYLAPATESAIPVEQTLRDNSRASVVFPKSVARRKHDSADIGRVSPAIPIPGWRCRGSHSQESGAGSQRPKREKTGRT